MSRVIERCKHFWQPEGPVASRWQHGHCLASCRYCEAWTAIDRGGIGPCTHSVGQFIGEQYLPGEPRLEPEFVDCPKGCGVFDGVSPHEEWWAAACDDCRERYNETL